MRGMVSFAFCFGLVVSLGTMPTAGNAEIKVQKYAPCEKLYFKMARYIKKVGATHYAVATTGGRSLKASNTGCGFDSGFDS